MVTVVWLWLIKCTITQYSIISFIVWIVEVYICKSESKIQKKFCSNEMVSICLFYWSPITWKGNTGGYTRWEEEICQLALEFIGNWIAHYYYMSRRRYLNLQALHLIFIHDIQRSTLVLAISIASPPLPPLNSFQ